MKYYETSLNDYIKSVSKMNIHKDHKLLKTLQETDIIENMLFYGPSGSGKYSQILYLLSKKDIKFKSQQKLYIDNNKDLKCKYIYVMSDIFFEVDMGLLGCNSKTLWHDIYIQILDIIMINPKKMGIILCKNFHLIHSELLDIFYSYLQDNYIKNDILIKYVIMTEQISFIPNKILNNFIIVNIPKPTKEDYMNIIKVNMDKKHKLILDNDINNVINIKDIYGPFKNYLTNNSNESELKYLNENNIIKNKKDDKTILEKVCNNIIEQIENSDKVVITEYRDILYEILTYNLDVYECIWYILSYFYKKNIFVETEINEIMKSIYCFLKNFNNNYRPIMHLESIIMLFILYYRKYNGMIT